jgi:hypothetical protein
MTLKYAAWATAYLLGLGTPITGTPVASPVQELVAKAISTITPGGAACGQNNATNRACWKNNWNINTDYETTTPPSTATRNVGGLLT